MNVSRHRQQWNPLLALGLLCLCPNVLGASPPLHPPGDCSEAEHKVMKAEVGRACKTTSMRCYEHHSCGELLANWMTYQRCISARVTIMNKCFRGGDERHLREVDNYKVGADDCSRFMTQKRCPQQCG